MARCARNWESVLRWTQRETLLPRQKETLKLFFENERALQSQPSNGFNHIYYVAKYGEFIKKPYEQAELDELKAYLSRLSTQQSKTPKISILKFYKWLLEPLGERRKLSEEGIEKPLNGEDRGHLSRLRRAIETIRKSTKNHQGYKQKLPAELLVPEDVLKLINASVDIRDKAIIAFLYDTGCRASELLEVEPASRNNPIANATNISLIITS